MGETNFDRVDVQELEVAGVDVTGSIPEIAAINGLTATKNELNLLDGAACNFTVAPAAGGANVCEVTIQAKDTAGANLTRIVPLLIWLSDAATGEGLTATSASGTVKAKAASGTDLAALTAKKALLVHTLANGKYILEITDSAKTEFKVCVTSLLGELPTIGSLETASYGS